MLANFKRLPSEKQFMCSSGATGLSELLEPFGAIQSIIANRLLISIPLGTLIWIIPSGFSDLHRCSRVSSGLGICSNTCSALMKSNWCSGIFSGSSD